MRIFPISKLLLVFLLLTGWNILAHAQPLTAIPYQANLEKANEYAEQNNYASQLSELEEAYKKRRDNSLLPLMAELNYKLRDYNRAETQYKRIVDKDKNGENIEALYKYGRMIKMNGRYAEAIPVLTAASNATSEPWASKAKLELEGITMAQERDSIAELMVKSAGSMVNTRAGEYSPTIYDGSLYFTSKITEDKKDPDDSYPAKVMRSVQKNDSWQKPVDGATQVNASSTTLGNVAIDKRTGEMFVTKVSLNGEEVASSRIYVAQRTGDDWSDPVLVQGLFDSAIVKNPMPGDLYGQAVLFFSSNTAGGQGGFDLYYATKLSAGNYDAPVNLGSMINTADDDITPFYRDGVLVFSTDGRPSYGGLDLYKSEWNGSSWSIPENMGPGYNSYADDMYYTLDDEGYQGFLVSNREGTISFKSKTCCDDIFQFDLTKPAITAQIYVLDQNKPLRGSTFMIMDEAKPADATTENGDNDYRYEYDLELNKGYQVKVTRPGYFPDSIFISTGGITSDTTIIRKINLLPKPEVLVISVNQPIRLNSIYYDYNDAKILPESEPDLMYLYDIMQEYPTIVIELSSHTDSRGGDDFNLALSQRRADSARDYLLAKGIAPERIVAVGYGETQILNKCVNGVKCTDEEHRFNRRTEFKITSGPTSIEIKKQVVKERGKIIKSETIKEK